jgi:peptidoglycan pentaglycine glycine transferase (the first glycine)
LPDDPAAWNRHVAGLPCAHVLQSWQWGDFKSRYGWHAERRAWPRAAAQVLARTALRGLRVLYVPKGPLLDWADAGQRAEVLGALESLARRQRAILIKVDPDVPRSVGPPGAEQPSPLGAAVEADLRRRGWLASREQVQFRNTAVLDLRQGDAELLAAMKPKTRYNLRLAERKGVTVREGGPSDLDLLYRLYAETAVRDGFAIRSRDYYQDAWGRFVTAGLAQPFLAEVAGEPVAALILFAFAGTAWYMYGMSREAHRDKMPNHLLQWRAITWARARGCLTYDFWGAPDRFQPGDPLWGVWRFKEGFGVQVERHIGAWDYAPAPWLYSLYTVLLPRLLAVMRWRGNRQVKAYVSL